MPLSPSPYEVFQTLPVPVLTSIATGGVDASDLARRSLTNQGLDAHGHWVGFGASDAYSPDTASVVIGALASAHHHISFLGDAFAGYDGSPEQVSQLLSELWSLVPGCHPLSVEELVTRWFDTQTPPDSDLDGDDGVV